MSDARVAAWTNQHFSKVARLGRHVKRGERALTLCMPITCKRRDEEADEEHTFTSFVYKARWFVLTQTEGEELHPSRSPSGTRSERLRRWESIRFHSTHGRQLPRLRPQAADRDQSCGSTPTQDTISRIGPRNSSHRRGDFADNEKTPRNLREVEAEAVALLCCESLELEGADYARGYIQNWLSRGSGSNAEAIPEKSAQKIFRAADQILRAGRSEVHSVTN